MVGKKRRRSDLSAGNLKDGDDNKRHPNSITALIRGIVSHWHELGIPRTNRSKATPKRFVAGSGFKDVYFATLDRFRGIKNASGQRNRNDQAKVVKNLAGMLEGLGADSRQTAVEYYHIRAFADFIGSSDSAFLAFAKTCSLERRSESRDEFIAALEQFIETETRFLSAILDSARSGDFDGFTFDAGKNQKTGKTIWIADIDQLMNAVEKSATEHGNSVYRSVMARD